MSILDLLKAIFNSFFNPKTVIPSNDLLELHNNHRKSIGLDVLIANNLLNSAAQKHSDWMFKNNKLNHNEDDKKPGDRILAEGYHWLICGENIAFGYLSASEVFQGWLESPEHKANIENSKFKDVGFGVSGKYWTAVFAMKLMGEGHFPEGVINVDIS